jgi:uncharacterized RDD family membrane protein YckC
MLLDLGVLYVIGFLIGLVIGSEEIGGLLGFVLGLIYQVYFLTQNNGQTLGKQLIGVRVVDRDGGTINAVEAALRYIGYHINTLLCGIGWIWALFDSEQRGFHDLIAGTRVIDV